MSSAKSLSLGIGRSAFISFLAGVFGLFLSVQAQEPAYTMVLENELTGTDIYSILQDTTGNILLTTDQGFMRYDGYKLEMLGNVREKTKSLFGLRQSDSGQIWCFNLSGQIFEYFQDSLYLYYELPDSLVSAEMMIDPTPQGDMIISCGHVVRLKSDKSLEVLDPSIPLREGGTLFRTGPESFLYLTRAGKEIRHYISGKWEVVPFADPNYIPLDSRNRSIMGNKEQIYMLSALGFEVFAYRTDAFHQLNLEIPEPLQNQRVIRIAQLWNNQLWLSLLRGGILRFDDQGRNPDNGRLIFSDYRISGYMVDREGSIWLPTLGSGILLLANPGVVHYRSERISTGEKVRGITADQKGNIIWATSEGNAYRCQEGEPAKLIGNIPGLDMVYLSHDTYSDETYFGTKTTLVSLKSEEGKTKILNGPNYSKNRTSYPGGLAVLPTTDGVYFTSPPNQPFSAELLRLHGFTIEKPGRAILKGINRSHCAYYVPETANLYVGSAVGLQFVNESGIHDLLWKGQTVIGRAIVQLDSSLWISSSQFGLLEARDGRLIRMISPAEGLHSTSIRKVVAHQGKLYLAMDKIIQIFDPATSTFESIDLSDGLAGDLIVDFTLSGATIWVAYENGIRAIPLGKIHPNEVPPLIRLTSFDVNRKPHQAGPKANLSYRENEVEFRFTGSGFRHQNQMQYAFRLLGTNAEWQIRPFGQNFASFNSLGPGSYTFQVKAINEDGVESAVLSQEFKIARPFWLTWWFIAACLLAVLGVMFIFFQSKIRNIRQKNALQLSKQRVEKELVDSRLDALRSQMNPHFIFNALNSIQDFILSNEKKLAAKYLGKFADLMRIYLNHSRKRIVLLSEELEALSIYLELEKLRFQDNLEYKIDVGTQLDPENAQIPSLIVQPFVENAIKHGLFHKMGERKLWVRFSLPGNGKTLICEVEDNGIGRKASGERHKHRHQNHNSHATASTRSRLELLNLDRQEDIGLFYHDLQDDQGRPSGTKVVLKIPLS